MNNQEPQSRMQRYNFNTDNNQPPKRKRPKKPHRIRQLIVSFLLTLVLIIGVGVWLANRSTSVETNDANTAQSANSSSKNEDDNTDTDSNSTSRKTPSEAATSQDDQDTTGSTDDNQASRPHNAVQCKVRSIKNLIQPLRTASRKNWMGLNPKQRPKAQPVLPILPTTLPGRHPRNNLIVAMRLAIAPHRLPLNSAAPTLSHQSLMPKVGRKQLSRNG
ncbi:hypothetical protein [Secundilactobacillus similis]|uniref:hypothetical protein n=1 Tax=Secundilactobacillus similis TaxID=414682 RepID=UPI0006CF7E45|nr:hypothetical protein [Secundilactobacillus similis]